MGNHTKKLCAWLLLLHYLTGAGAFLIYNSQHTRCLEYSGSTGEVLLKKCDRDSNLQQWVWINQTKLMCVATSRCLWARPRKPAQMLPCDWQDADVVFGLKWDCDRDELMCRNTSMLLTVIRQHLVLKPHSKHSAGRSLDEGHICQEKQRFKRGSDVSNELEVAEEETEKLAAMTPEEREFLRWFYRTEDPTTWKFVLLGLAFICLLLGFMLLGMGVVANKSRKKIAKYKAAASLIQTSEKVELRGVSSLPGRNTTCEESHGVPGGNHVHVTKLDTTELKSSGIVITWKDGNTSCMYPEEEEEERVEPDPEKESEQKLMEEPEGKQIQEEEQNQEEQEQKEKEKEKETMEEEKIEAEKMEGEEEMKEQNEAAAAELEGNDEVTTKE